MNLSTHPNFCSTISKQWLFPFTVKNISLCHCTFDKNNFNNIDYQQSTIKLPSYLQTALNKRKAEYLVGRWCAQEALIKLGIQGYPSVNQDKSPCWPAAICGSISHSHYLAAAVVAKQNYWQSLGLDIEQLLNNQRSERLLATITNQREQQLRGEDISLFTTLAFSIKESLFKALYPLTKQRFYFEDAEIIQWSREGDVILKLLTNLSKQWPAGSLVTGQFCIKENFLWSFIGIQTE